MNNNQSSRLRMFVILVNHRSIISRNFHGCRYNVLRNQFHFLEWQIFIYFTNYESTIAKAPHRTSLLANMFCPILHTERAHVRSDPTYRLQGLQVRRGGKIWNSRHPFALNNLLCRTKATTTSLPHFRLLRPPFSSNPVNRWLFPFPYNIPRYLPFLCANCELCYH